MQKVADIFIQTFEKSDKLCWPLCSIIKCWIQTVRSAPPCSHNGVQVTDVAIPASYATTIQTKVHLSSCLLNNKLSILIISRVSGNENVQCNNLLFSNLDAQMLWYYDCITWMTVHAMLTIHAQNHRLGSRKFCVIEWEWVGYFLHECLFLRLQFFKHMTKMRVYVMMRVQSSIQLGERLAVHGKNFMLGFSHTRKIRVITFIILSMMVVCIVLYLFMGCNSLRFGNHIFFIYVSCVQHSLLICVWLFVVVNIVKKTSERMFKVGSSFKIMLWSIIIFIV